MVLATTVLAGPGVAAESDFVAPVKVAPGNLPSLAVDGAGKSHIAYTNDKRGLSYATNKSGSWVRQTITRSPADPTTRDTQASLAVDGNGKVHIAFVRYDFSVPNGGLGLFYATNKSGSWVVKKLHAGNDLAPSLAVHRGAVHIAFWVYAYPGRDSVKHLSNETGTWEIQNVTSAGSPGYPSLMLIKGDPRIAFVRFTHISESTPCGVYLWRPGTDPVWTSRDASNPTDPMPFNTCDFTRPTVGLVSDGIHIVFGHRDTGEVGNLWHSYKQASANGAWGIEQIAMNTQSTSNPTADMAGGRIDVVFSRELECVGCRNGLHYIKVTKQPEGGWAPNIGGPQRITTRSDTCAATTPYSCDVTPSLALVNGSDYLAFYRGGAGVMHTHN